MTENLSKSHTVLGFDFGLRRIGIAVGDRGTGIASPLTTLVSNGDIPDWSQIAAIIAEWQPGMLVVGVPYNMDGSDSALTGLARQFGRELKERFGVTVDSVDERLSSREAEAELTRGRQQGLRRRRIKKTDVDKIAARIILDTWLAHQKN